MFVSISLSVTAMNGSAPPVVAVQLLQILGVLLLLTRVASNSKLQMRAILR